MRCSKEWPVLVDRFAICDLDTDHYEHHERKKEDLYPAEGSFRELREEISRKYVALTDGENAKLTQMLSPENLRAQIKTSDDSLKFEYAARDRSTFLMMTVVPCGWENGRLTRVRTCAAASFCCRVPGKCRDSREKTTLKKFEGSFCGITVPSKDIRHFSRKRKETVRWKTTAE